MNKIFRERGNAFFRLLDRYVGIPIVFFLSLFKKRRPLPDEVTNIDHIVFIKMSGIGDSVLTLPLIKKIRQTYPDGSITVICGKNNQIVYRNLLKKKYIDTLILMEYGRLIFDWKYTGRLIKKIRAVYYDFSVDLDPWSRLSALISLLLKSNYKLGFRKKKQFKHYPYDYYNIHRQSQHEFDAYRNLVRPLTGPIERFPNYPVADEDSILFDEFIKNHNIREFIVFHPWAAGYKHMLKELDTGAIAYICNKLSADGYQIIITGGKADVEKSNILTDQIEHSFSIAGKTSLNETAIFLQRADCVVTVNTGVLHLAAAMDAKIVSINGPTDINRWGPLCDKAINIKSSLFCSPCLDLGFEYKCKDHGVADGYCMKKVGLDEVVNAACELAG